MYAQGKSYHRSSGFNSIFKSYNYLQTFKNQETSTNTELSDGNISECSNISTRDTAFERENQISPICISGYSSDENTSDTINNSFGSRNSSYVLNNSNKTSTAKKRRRRPQRKPLDKLKICRNPKKRFSTIEPKRVLKILNSPVKEQRCANESPCNKIRNVFRILESTPRRMCQNNITELRHNSQTPPSCVEKIAEESIEWSSSSSNSEASFDSAEKCSQVISTPSTSSQASNPPTELDLLLALIERESNSDKKKSQINAKTTKKRCRKGGYLQELLRTLEAAKTDRKYLEHDKKFGLQSGIRLSVVELEVTFGVHFAIGQLEDEEYPQRVRILLDAELSKQVKVGSKIETFFNASCGVFTSKKQNDEAMPTYVQPHRLLLL